MVELDDQRRADPDNVTAWYANIKAVQWLVSTRDTF